MFERFTDRARRVVVLAQEEAGSLGNDRIGPEHLLLALIDEGGGVAVRALEALGVGLATVRQCVEADASGGEQPPGGHIPFAEQTKDLLKLSLVESRGLGHDYIGTEHILLALLRQDESAAARLLADLGADLERARAEVVRLLDEHRRRPGGAG